eukprot:4896826-Pyramimonas_sp.AAC.1
MVRYCVVGGMHCYAMLLTAQPLAECRPNVLLCCAAPRPVTICVAMFWCDGPVKVSKVIVRDVM